MSVLAKLEKAVDIVRYDAQSFAPRPRSYDGILSTETLYRIERKEDLLIKLSHTLKSRGQLVITDFVLGPGVSAHDERLKAAAPGAAFFWPANRYVRHFRERDFDLRVSEDITARYRSPVVDGCKRVAVGGPAVTAEAKAYPEAMAALLDLWASRVAAFDSGLLNVMRFSTIKLGNLKLMSGDVPGVAAATFIVGEDSRAAIVRALARRNIIDSIMRLGTCATRRISRRTPR